MSIDETITAFTCCVSKPPDCKNCPLQGPGFGFACRDSLKNWVKYWLGLEKARHETGTQGPVE